MLLDLPRDVICSVARFRLCAYTLQIENVTWTHDTSPTCDLCNAHDVQDEQHILFHCTHPHMVSLCRNCFAGIFLLSQIFLQVLIIVFEQANITLFD